MSLRKKGVITKISSISLFVLLMLINIKIAFSDKNNGDIEILGIKLSNSGSYAAPVYDGYLVVGACLRNCINPVGDYCWKCATTTVNPECSYSNAYCANN